MLSINEVFFYDGFLKLLIDREFMIFIMIICGHFIYS